MTTRLSDDDLHLFGEGSHYRLHEHLGAHPSSRGTYFAVWAPNAAAVSVIGDWNGWHPGEHRLEPRASSGIWEGFVPGVAPGAMYKYAIEPRGGRVRLEKADPFATFATVSPDTASIVWDLEYTWSDASWMRERGPKQQLSAPMSIYELHLGSWRRADGRPLPYAELTKQLVDYVHHMGFTHVELMPVTEHPFYGSWGYQTTGYFAPTSRYGAPQDFMALVDALHRAGIGVILDWVPSHFPGDAHGLRQFDGTDLFEHADPRQGFQPDWNSFVFNYGRHEVRSFLISSALSWLDRYHIDGLRVDAVASMLYLDYSRKAGEWIPNEHGGRENLEAIEFLRRLNAEVYRSFPDTQTIAEESTAWPMVSRPTYLGGLGFGLKWDMGWMHDTLHYMAREPVHRSFHYNEITFRMIYAFNENFVLPLSHDEVVHGKGSLLGRMPGDDWQRFANLRLLLTYMYAQPGKKLLFMGGELAQWSEWNHEQSLDWHLLEHDSHAGMQRLVRDLNHRYKEIPALHARDVQPDGFAWVEANDVQQSCLAFLRTDGYGDWVVCAFNFTPVPRHNYRVGVPEGGWWDEVFNSDASIYGGGGQGNLGGREAMPVPAHGHMRSLSLTIPPLGAVLLRAPSSR